VLLPLADRIETITYDNGKEFASPERVNDFETPAVIRLASKRV
jgi:IS30 family transposase